MAKKHILYLSYDGMTDPLGQSQVIPYLRLLAKEYDITLISFEKSINFSARRADISELLLNEGIRWLPLRYSKKPPIISTLWDLFKLYIRIGREFKKTSFQIIHCRSYLTTLIAYRYRHRSKIIFDMRGFWIDERVEGKIWDTGKIAYRFIFSWLKKKEKQMVTGADAVVSLTEKAVPIIRSWQNPDAQSKPITVIPCCTDTLHFDRSQEHLEFARQKKKELHIPADCLVVGYLGSIGTWYQLDEMLDFFQVFQRRKKAIFLFITTADKHSIEKSASDKGISTSDIRITKALRESIPSYSLMMDFSLFFINPTFSKQASSPTKLAELMSLGIPVLCNTGIGDVDKIIQNENAGILIDEMTQEKYEIASEKIIEFLNDYSPEKIRSSAIRLFDISQGANKYSQLYQEVSPPSM